MTSSERELSWLRRACDLSHELVDVRDPQRLLPLILDSAIELSGAERGFLVRVVDRTIRVDVARGFDGASLQGGASSVSRRVVQQVIESGEGVVTVEDDREILNATTLQAKRVLAILCAPMRLRGAIVGVIYLDHRFLADPFQRADLEPLRLFADQAALAIDMADLEAQHEDTKEALDQARVQLEERKHAEQRRKRLLSEHRSLEARPGDRFGDLLGASSAALRLFSEIERAARSNDPLLVVGETGSGKSAAVRELHRLSAGETLIVEHCATLTPEGLRERLASSDQGLLVLEGIDDAPPELQAALVVALRTDEAQSRGLRLIATGTPDLESRLREDLFFRLGVFQLDVPPLRERRKDIPLFLDHASRAAGRALEFTPNALQALVDYGWPGNVLELEGLVRRLVDLEKKITRRDLPPGVLEGSPSSGSGPIRTMADMERQLVDEALEACGGNKAQAARKLGIQRSTLYRILSRPTS